jgi:hypothetical protein
MTQWDRLQPGKRQSLHHKNQPAATGLFQAKACPTKTPHDPSGTGFSREGVSRYTTKIRLLPPANSRLKPVPLKQRITQWDRLQPGRRQSLHHTNQAAATGQFPAKACPTKTTHDPSGTGFSREGVSRCAATVRLLPLTYSRPIKPVLHVYAPRPRKPLRP